MKRLACILTLLLAALPACAALEWKLGGRVQLDATQFEGVYSVDGGTHGAAYLRRAELELGLRWHPRWRAELALEADSALELQVPTAYVAWRPWRTLELKFGRVDPDFGLEPSSSTSWGHGVERAALWDLVPEVASAEEGFGLRADQHGTGWHGSAGLYDKHSHRAATGRFVWLPRVGGGQVVQLGASLSAASGSRSDGRIRTRLGVRGVSENGAGRRSLLADAGVFDEDRAAGLEFAWQRGPWMLQAEAVDRRFGASQGARGASVLGAWSWTGSVRRHDERRARFGRPTGRVSAWGHWETFVRAERLQADPGRSATLLTVGVAWTAEDRWRALVNLHHARSEDDNAAGDTRGVGIAARLQATF
jgi:phosphate-selective porin OprO/OprP